MLTTKGEDQWEDAPTAVRGSSATLAAPAPDNGDDGWGDWDEEWDEAPTAGKPLPTIPTLAPVSPSESSWDAHSFPLSPLPIVQNPQPNPDRSKKKNASADLYITTDDIDLFTFLLAHKCATKEQIARFLDRTTDALAKRLPKLVRHGLLQEESFCQRKAYAPTGVSLRKYCGVKRNGVPFPGNLRHALSLVDLYLKLKDDARLYGFVTDREMRSQAAKNRPGGGSFKKRKDKTQKEIEAAMVKAKLRDAAEYLPD